MPNLYPYVRPLLWSLPTEAAHRAALWSLRARLGNLATRRTTRQTVWPELAQTLWGLEFRNPVGVAAGFDKNALVPDEILRLGFGCTEIGTVTPKPQPGNPAPRLFRLDHNSAIINSMGFPSAGLDVVLARLARRGRRRGILGINVGKNKQSPDAGADYVEGIVRAAPYADYLVANVSSPNTPGLRDLQRRDQLEALLVRLIAARNETARRPPLLVKIAPDLDPQECADIAEVAMATGIDGIIVGNTTVKRPPGLGPETTTMAGGFSGPALFAPSTRILSEMYRLTGGQLPLIGVGGVFTAAEAYAKICAGASLVQVHTALIFRGIDLVGEINEGLCRLLRADGFRTIADAVGTANPPARVDPPQRAYAIR